MVGRFHFWCAKSGKSCMWDFRMEMGLQTRHLLCLQTRHLLCQQTRHLLCHCVSRHLPRHPPQHSLHRGGREAAAPVSTMPGGCLGRRQMSCLLTQQMSCLQTQQMSCCLQTGQGVQGRGLWGQGCAALHPKAHLEKGKLVFARGCRNTQSRSI